MCVLAIVIVDNRTGNYSSVKRAFERVGSESVISSDPEQIIRADKLVLAGVGHFDRAVSGLHEQGVTDALLEAVFEKRTPVLGICLGMEIMAKRSEEGSRPGLGWLDAEVVRFRVSDSRRYKVPNIGWEHVTTRNESRLLRGIGRDDEFYFLHSYHLSNTEYAIAETIYESVFPAAIQFNNIFGVQFHPEKSHKSGLKLLRNFVEI
jgi:imidazole glycerol-phosphate synthase subunit HisH